MKMPECTALAHGTEGISFDVLLRKLNTRVTGNEHVVVLYTQAGAPYTKVIKDQADIDEVINLATGDDPYVEKPVWCGSPTAEPDPAEHMILASMIRW